MHTWLTHTYRNASGLVREIEEPTDTMSINLHNTLDIDGRYSIQVYAENIHGRSEGSRVVNFTRSSGK